MNIAQMLLNDFIVDQHPEEFEHDDTVQFDMWLDEQDAPIPDAYIPPEIDLSDLPW
jgi:hypothetical protein